MTWRAPRIDELLAGGGDELPVVAVRTQRQLRTPKLMSLRTSLLGIPGPSG